MGRSSGGSGPRVRDKPNQTESITRLGSRTGGGFKAGAVAVRGSRVVPIALPLTIVYHGKAYRLSETARKGLVLTADPTVKKS